MAESVKLEIILNENNRKTDLSSKVCSTTCTRPTAHGTSGADCRTMTQNADLNPIDVQTYNVHYDDCSTAWVLCRHKSNPDPLINIIDLFGRLPVKTRSYVRLMIVLPDPNSGRAYNSNGNLAMFNRINGDLTVFVH
ncbi:MAG: hypothetical protein Q9222_000159 [Ikaeria aurantiellina]